MKDSLLSPLFYDCLLLWASLQATQPEMQQDSLLCQPRLFYDRAWLPVKSRAPQRVKTIQRFHLVMPSFELSYACDVLPGTVLPQATLPEKAIALAQRKPWQVRLQRKELGIF